MLPLLRKNFGVNKEQGRCSWGQQKPAGQKSPIRPSPPTNMLLHQPPSSAEPCKQEQHPELPSSMQWWRIGFFKETISRSRGKNCIRERRKSRKAKGAQTGARGERRGSVGARATVAGMFAVFGHIPFRLQFPSCLIVLDVSFLPQECHPDLAAPDVWILCRKPVNKFLLFFLLAIRNVGRTHRLTGKESAKDIQYAFIGT